MVPASAPDTIPRSAIPVAGHVRQRESSHSDNKVSPLRSRLSRVCQDSPQQDSPGTTTRRSCRSSLESREPRGGVAQPCPPALLRNTELICPPVALYQAP